MFPHFTIAYFNNALRRGVLFFGWVFTIISTFNEEQCNQQTGWLEIKKKKRSEIVKEGYSSFCANHLYMARLE